jgi:glycine/D-amino acid oxidase-like deaminating enzyme
MTTGTWDVIVVGGGMAGLATAYHLAKLGARTLLLQADDLGGGTSAACAGRAQAVEGHLDPLNLQLVRDGLARLDTLEAELDHPFEWRKPGYLCLIETEAQWDEWKERAAILTAAGLPTEMLDVASLRAAEPYMNTAGLLGAAYAVEGHVNPFLFCWAYARAAQRIGATLCAQTPVTGMVVSGRRVLAVETGAERFAADRVAVMCGAWTPLVTHLAGVEVPIRHTHAEAFVTEPLPPLVHHTIGLAGFYEAIHGKAKAVAVGVGPQANGTLLVTEAVAQTDQLHRRSSAWGLGGMAAELVHLFPVLTRVQAVRGWAIPTPFTPDDEPIIGWVPERENLFVAASFLLTITAMPVLGEWLARMLLGEPLDVSLEQYAPERFGQN